MRHLIISIIITCLLLCFGSGFASATDLTKNDLISFLNKKGHAGVTLDREGDIVVKVATANHTFTIWVLLIKKRDTGEVWALKTLAMALSHIPRQKYTAFVKMVNAFNSKKGVCTSAHLRKKGDESSLFLESWFPMEFADENCRKASLENFYENSFRMVTKKLEFITLASLCVKENSSDPEINLCLGKIGLKDSY